MNNLFVIFLFITTHLYATEIEKSEQQHFIFPKWKEFHLLNKKLLHSHDHHAKVDIYTNDIATQSYIGKKTHFPEGSIILKPLYKENDRNGYLARLVVMVKMHEGYDSKNNDWWYGVYDKTGTTVWFEGRIKSCIKCHEIAKETDYLFSEQVMEEIDFEE